MAEAQLNICANSITSALATTPNFLGNYSNQVLRSHDLKKRSLNITH
ncbi:MAG: hypothetical protein RMY34_10250 [Aulosira sp. DedQUE10]|nr:hypothetical protein [Aulosira sp. DedQUE10]